MPERESGQWGERRARSLGEAAQRCAAAHVRLLQRGRNPGRGGCHTRDHHQRRQRHWPRAGPIHRRSRSPTRCACGIAIVASKPSGKAAHDVHQATPPPPPPTRRVASPCPLDVFFESDYYTGLLTLLLPDDVSRSKFQQYSRSGRLDVY